MTDIPPPEPAARGRISPFAELLQCMRFLTRLPVPFARTVDLPPLSQSMRLFPVVGAMIGAAVGGTAALATLAGLSPLLSAILACAFGLMITGALHEDGLADTFDGFGGGKTRDARLAIMRDSRIGTYGALALGIVVLTRVAALADLLSLPTLLLVGVAASCAAFSRALVVDLLWATQPARSDGLSVLAGRPGRNGAAFAIVTAAALIITTGFMLRPESGLIALGAGLGVTAIIRHLSIRLIGGQTGDVCGAVQCLSEAAMLCVFVATKT